MRDEIKGLNGELLLECDGCWNYAPQLFSRTFKDTWDSGEMVSGDYCRECRELIDGGQVLPNMRAPYRRP